ncbi:hypothetical protein RRG08_037867 [Elysia crispata]|uniref:Uncharacterized protein n=1 Tax=Elysia crispata TaxID=231223 RepID=A0AAE0ZJV3_9GAST|nr:hypothetical protein RRG08_037867 [Elysia crispata]
MSSFERLFFLCLINFGLLGVHFSKGQTANRVITKNGDSAEISFDIPDMDQVIGSSTLHIKVDPQDGSGFDRFSNLMFVSTRVLVVDKYKSKVEAQLIGRTLKINFRTVNASDAGYISCYTGPSESNLVADCGQQLVVLSPPSTPEIVPLPLGSAPLADKELRLQCKSESKSRPPIHGFGFKIQWMDGEGRVVSTGTRFYVNNQSELQVDRLSRGDKNRKFVCMTSDIVEGWDDSDLRSQLSDLYTVSPEYAPSQSSLKVTPFFENGAIISKSLSANLRFECSADCNPPCEVKWMYKANAKSSRFSQVQGLVDPSILVKSGLDRLDLGTYRCRAKNEHSGTQPARKDLRLELLYIEPPQVFMNSKPISNASVWEHGEGKDSIELKCVFDANPRPVIKWVSPSGDELMSDGDDGPLKGMNEETRIWESLFTSRLVLNSLRCEDAGIYTCHGSSHDAHVEGRMNINVKCGPKPAKIPGKILKKEYAWIISTPLKVEFVMRGWPAPKIKRIWSSQNGNTRNEIIGEHIIINSMTSYEGKPWLTFFQITSKRNFTKEDTGREFTMEFFTPDYTQKYEFKIRQRGPPNKVSDITVESVTHDSVDVFWRSGFDGGEVQVFSVEYRKRGNDGEASAAWVVGAKDVPDIQHVPWLSAKIMGLQPSTEYSLRVVAYNAFGTSQKEFFVKTMSAPSSGLSAGAICGIVFGIVIFLLIVAFLLYWFVWRKKYGKGLNDFRIADLRDSMRDTMRKLIKRNEDRPTQNGGGPGDAKPNKNPIYKMKKLVKRVPKMLKKDYNTVPPKDVENDDDHEDDFSDDEFDDDDDQYMNGEELKKTNPDEIVYANASAIRKNQEDKKKNEGREKNDEGLVYVSVDFPNSNLKPAQKNNNNNNNNGGTSSTDRKTPQGIMPQAQEDPVEYTQIDFSKTKTPLKNGVHQEVTAEVNPTLKQEEDDSAEPDRDNVSAADGGADVEAADGGADNSKAGAVIPEAKFDTAV